MSRDLSRLFAPKSVAVIGGGTWCAAVVTQLKRAGFAGEIWPVHPTRPEVGGTRAVASVDDLPGPPDASYVGVNRHATIDVVGALSAAGAGGAVCFASGFAEAQAELADGDGLQDALLAAAGDMPVLGPNCYGFVNYLDNVVLWPDQHGGRPVDQGVGLLMQSSNIAINLTMQARALPLAMVVTLGNQAQLGMGELGLAMLEDPRITALGMYIEGIGCVRTFEALARRAQQLGKPIIALKAGRSEAARQATVSHTASLAGSDAGGRALLRRLGVAEVDSVPALLETLRLVHMAGPLASASVATMSCSGGEASLLADAATRHAVDLPALKKEQETALRAALGPKVALANPLDYHTYIWGDVAAMAATYAAMTLGEQALTCVIADFPRQDRCDPSGWDCVIEAAAQARARTGRPIAIVTSMAENLPEEVAERATASGLIPMQGLDEMLEAVEAAAFVGGAMQTTDVTAPVLLPGKGGDGIVSEREAKRMLAKHGVQVPASLAAGDAETAVLHASELGFPVVLKGEGAAHKSEAGLVAVGLTDAAAVRDAARAMTATGFLVEEMVTGQVAEILVGVVRDPAHGFVLTLAAGGVLTELLADRVSLMLPVTRDMIHDALGSLRIQKLLSGYRGQPPANVDAVVRAVTAVQDFVIANSDILEEVEINPLMCTPDRAVAADALIRMGTREN